MAALVARELDLRGTLDVLRHGVADSGVKLRLAFFQPASGLNAEALAAYATNVLTVIRQVRYATKDAALSIDMVLAVNGLPVATAELKNPFTGQAVEHAKHPYRHDRDPWEPLLRWKGRALVHFAVDPDLVFMATKRQGHFLPALQQWAPHRGGQSAQPEGLPHRLPLGGGLGQGQLARHPRPLRPRREVRQGQGQGRRLPALPPVGRGAEGAGPRARPS